MGIYDRTYIRDDDSAALWGGRTAVVNLILLNVGCYIAQMLFKGMDEWCGLLPNLFTHPWQAYQLLTYGFLHDRYSPLHLIFNMFFLWMFGRDVESIYGPREFLRVYLTLIVMSGLVWAIAAQSGAPAGNGGPLVGASGGVMGIMTLWVLHYPRRTILLMGIVPLPAWAMLALYIGEDIFGGMQRTPGDHVAHAAHLAGALFGFIYFRSGWNLGRMIPARVTDWFGPKLRLHQPEPEADTRTLSQQVDAILEKISREGESRLTKQERRTLEEASRHYQRRRT